MNTETYNFSLLPIRLHRPQLYLIQDESPIDIAYNIHHQRFMHISSQKLRLMKLLPLTTMKTICDICSQTKPRIMHMPTSPELKSRGSVISELMALDLLMPSSAEKRMHWSWLMTIINLF